MKHKNCLLLNSDYMPLCIIDWKKALILDYGGGNIDVLEYYAKDTIKCPGNKTLKLPSVIKLTKYVNIYRQHVHFSRKNLFIRDDYKCQYCMNKFPTSKLTYDHVIPKSRWNKPNSLCTHWNNVVTCCRECNLKKGNKILSKTNMKLHSKPIQPINNHKYLYVNYYIRFHKQSLPEEWDKYIV